MNLVKIKSQVRKDWELVLLGGVFVSLLAVIAHYHYLLFHTLVEGFSIVVVGIIYVLATRTYKYSGHDYLLFLGIAYPFIAMVDFMHAVTYGGICWGMGPNLSTQLWVAARYMEAITLLVAPFFVIKKLKPRWLVWGTYCVTTGVLFLMFRVGLFPDCYVAGLGLSKFKVASEIVVCVILMASVVHLKMRSSRMNNMLFKIMVLSSLLTVLAEFSFTLYNDVYGVMNFVGHMFKLGSFILIYWGIVLRGLEYPFDLVFEKMRLALEIMQENSLKDPLTGLFNRRGFRELAGKELSRGQKENYQVEFLYLDLDNFKEVNDKQGHWMGDKVLKEFASIMMSAVSENDIVARLGGDEFIMVISRAGEQEAVILDAKIKEGLKQNELIKSLKPFTVGYSLGSVLWLPGDTRDLEEVLNEADSLMYENKEKKKYQ